MVAWRPQHAQNVINRFQSLIHDLGDYNSVSQRLNKEYEVDKDFRKLLKAFPELVLEHGGKHLRLRHPTKPGFIAVSSTSSDRNYLANVRRDLERFF